MPSSSSLYNASLNSSKLQKRKRTPPPSTANLTFSSTLSSLLASSSNQPKTSSPAPRTSKPPKDSIFSIKTKTTKPRKTSDGHTTQAHSTTSEDVDAATLHRSKRRMEEKARLYASMQRGDYVPRKGGRDKEVEGLVDFDRKWADKKDDPHTHDTSSDDYADSDTDKPDKLRQSTETEGAEDLVEFEDEFGRLRQGTRAQLARHERKKNAAAYAEAELADMSARPAAPRPEDLIIGNTVQSGAYNPDETIAERMARLAEKRERSLTPPEETHYDASKEIRSKGVGFYQFSTDEGERRRQMEELGRERGVTERVRGEMEMGKGREVEVEEVVKREVEGESKDEEEIEKVMRDLEAKREEEEKRRRESEKVSGTNEADRFLEELGGEVAAFVGEEENGKHQE